MRSRSWIVSSIVFGAVLATAAARGQEARGQEARGQEARRQEARDPRSFVPADALLALRMQSMKGFVKAFGPTRLGRMLGGPEISGMIGDLVKTGEAQLREKLGAEGLDYDELRKALLEYEGDVTIAVGFDGAKIDKLQTLDDIGPTDLGLWCVIVLAGDGKTDLAAFARKTTELAEKKGGDELREVKALGRRFLASPEDEGVAMTLPFVEGEHLVAVVGAPLDSALAFCLDPKTSLASSNDIAGKRPFEMSIALGPLKSLMHKAIAAEAGPMAEIVGPIIDAIGLTALDRVTMSAYPAADLTVQDLTLHLKQGERGILRAFLEVPDGRPEMLPYVPIHLDWSLTKMRFDLLYAELAKIADQFAEQSGMTREQLEEQFAQMFRVRLKEDLIDHLGGEFLSVGAAAPGPDGEASMLNGVCYAIALRDAKSFGTALETALRSRGLHVSRKTEEYRGTKIHELRLMPEVTLYYGVSSRFAFVALGDQGNANARAMLDAEGARAEGEAPNRLPDAVEARLEHAARGWQSVGASRLQAIAEMLPAALSGEEIDASVRGPLLEIAKQLAPLFDKYGLKTMVSVMRARPDSLSYQAIW